MRARGLHTVHRFARTDALLIARDRRLTGPAPLQPLSIGPPRPTRTTDRRRSPSAGLRERSSRTSSRPPARRRSRSLKEGLAPSRPKGRPSPHPSGLPSVPARTGEPSLPPPGASGRGHRMERPRPGRATATAPPRGRRPTTQPDRSDICSPPQDAPVPGSISSPSPGFSTPALHFASGFPLPGHAKFGTEQDSTERKLRRRPKWP